MRVSTEQSLSSGGPSVSPLAVSNSSVWQRKGASWGPEMIGPEIG